MNDPRIGPALGGLAERAVPDDGLDLWPAVAARLARRGALVAERRRTGRRRRAAALLAAAAVAVVAVAAAPGGTALLEAARAILTGVSVPADPSASLSLIPEPPFAVYQPTALPPDLRQRTVSYSPGPDPATGGRGAVAVSENHRPAVQDERRGLRLSPRLPYLLVTYWGADGRELVLLARTAARDDELPAGEPLRVLDRPASLAETAGGRLLSLRVDATWLQVWTNLDHEELARATASLRPVYPGRSAELAPSWRVVEAPAAPKPSGRSPAFLRPTYIPATLDYAGGWALEGPAHGPTGRLPERPSAGSARPLSWGEIVRTPVAERLDWAWFRDAWRAMGGGYVVVGFGQGMNGSGEAYLEVRLAGPARFVGEDGVAPVTTPAGRVVWLLRDADAVDARWWDGSAVVIRRSPEPQRGGEAVVWQHGETLARVRSNLPREEQLRFIDGLVAE